MLQKTTLRVLSMKAAIFMQQIPSSGLKCVERSGKISQTSFYDSYFENERKNMAQKNGTPKRIPPSEPKPGLEPCK